ncbi:MAG TPA: CARDB domain-containing protein, partial [Candidatus Paceibacterota bacterium]|nr:CARDB domain-containing protein [Candidatus Paceibacterota bacterium]
GSGSATCSAIVSNPPVPAAQPDLTPGGISPTTATAGESVTVTATLNNVGTAVANASRAYIRIPGSKGDLYADYPNIPAVQPGSNRTVSFNVTLPSEGSYPVEVCADWYGAVAESNEGNNCATYSISVASRPITSSVSCDVSSRNVNLGGSVTYTTSTSGSAGAPYSWSSPQGGGPFGNNATANRTFNSVGTYQMTVSAQGASAAATCPVVNVSICPGTRSATITATPNRVNANGTATIAWSATAINTSCTISGPGVNQTVNSSSCTVPNGSVVTPAISTQSTYTISCDGGAVTDTAIVNVIPQFEEF